MITGYPVSGKSRRASQLRDFFLQRIAEATDAPTARLKVHIVNSESLDLSHDVYHSAKSEKNARAAEYSAVKRLLSRDAIVILDALNYIKGFRYQLFCEAKALQTTSCVVSSQNGARLNVTFSKLLRFTSERQALAVAI